MVMLWNVKKYAAMLTVTAICATCSMRHIQIMHGGNELFVLDIIWFAPEGCTQAEICTRMSATKQTISAIIKKFMQLGYLTLTEAPEDRRQKIICLTESGRRYVKKVIQPAADADAEIDAMAELDGTDIAELVRLTEKFSEMMSKKFSEA